MSENTNTGNTFTLNYSGDQINKILSDSEELSKKIKDLNSSLYSVFPTGSIILYAGDNAPSGWFLCNGAELSRDTYAELFSVIGTTYCGYGYDDPTKFVLPNLSGRVPVGFGADYPLGEIGGESEHMLTVDEMPNHNHVLSDSESTDYRWSSSDGAWANFRTGTEEIIGNGITTRAVGGDKPHNNMQPYVVMNYIIKYGSVSNAD